MTIDNRIADYIRFQCERDSDTFVISSQSFLTVYEGLLRMSVYNFSSICRHWTIFDPPIKFLKIDFFNILYTLSKS